MPPARQPEHEAARLNALRHLGILDTPAEQEFDDLTSIAATVLGMPIAIVSLVDEERQWFKSCVGLDAHETHRDQAICAHTILDLEPLVIEDTTFDERTADNPLVTGEPGIRFYAGVPLVLDGGLAVGTLCVIDTTPRALSETQFGLLVSLGRQVTALLKLRLTNARLVAERERSERVNSILEQTSRIAQIGAWMIDLDENRLMWTDEVFRIHGLTPGEAPSVEEAIAFYAPEHRPLVAAAVQKAIDEQVPWDLEAKLITATREEIWVRAIGEAIIEGGRATRLQGVFQDITERKAAEDDLWAAATHDGLTGLPNRSVLLEHISACIEASECDPTFHFAVLFLDFDRFKIVNDSLGHDAGDDLLTQIAERLRVGIREGDTVTGARRTAGRLGGDEFVIVLEGIDHPDHATVVADRLLEMFREPFRLGAHEVVSTASIGIVTSETAASTAEEILRDADTAMYEAKVAGKARHVSFDHDMRVRARQRLSIEQHLRNALDDREIRVVYEPIVCTESGRWVGFEALARWTLASGRVVRPCDFVPIAEETGLIIDLGEQVLERSCEDLVKWNAVLPESGIEVINVNLSRSQLATTGIAERFVGIVERYGLEPGRVRLEVTESQIIGHRNDVLPVLRELQSAGFRLAIDDFGTGMSSLSALHDLPIDMIKIDRSFAEHCDRRREVIAMAKAVVDISSALRLTTVAEGIETIEQLVELQTIDCPLAQGFFFSKGLTGEEVLERLRLGTGRSRAA